MRVLLVSVVLCVSLTVVTACGSCNDGWEIMFSAKAGTGEQLYPAWTGSTSVNSGSPCADVYKSAAAEDWTLVDLVKLAVLVNNVEKSYFIFNGKGAGKADFMTEARLLASSNDVTGKTFNFFSAVGSEFEKRRFYINQSWGGCPADAGWLAVVDAYTTDPCSWADRATTPFFLYCESDDACLSDTALIGDTFTISVVRRKTVA